jgi:hypothetical protein
VVRSTVITRGALHRGALPATRLGSVQDEVDGRLWVTTIRVIDAQRDHAETRRPDAPVSRFDYIETDAESERTEVQAFMMFVVPQPTWGLVYLSTTPRSIWMSNGLVT